ncbi:uncharacterized protein HD556DRAFT_1496519 [Suillus plorans]|uniref:Uncharacterized protein n=1 Tax=Suillus plorans TaxID=116603 RepID=A0A9P7DCL1_9AGAM|nr:uncharacterized protein HD556DRAFT_1496519 [Suillus plorans]KAG1788617.1 hypothetical protein HD556DRAFT_1496519 [Suillus plorans]
MEEIDRAIRALKADIERSNVNGGVNDAFHNFALYLVLLKSSSPSLQSTSKLCEILRQSPLPLYAAVPRPALQLSSAIMCKIIDNLRTTPLVKSQPTQLIVSWNETAAALLSGVLDSSSALLQQTQVIAFSLLRDTLAKHPGNQRRLRDHAVLGWSFIGMAISQSKDYLVIDALLDLVGLLMPSNKTEEGKEKRTTFIKELFGSMKHFSCSFTLVDSILQSIEGSCWEDTSMKVMDALARSDITFVISRIPDQHLTTFPRLIRTSGPPDLLSMSPDPILYPSGSLYSCI